MYQYKVMFPMSHLQGLHLPGRVERDWEVAWHCRLNNHNCANLASKSNSKPGWARTRGQKPNKAAHIKYGNRSGKHGCVLASWNCRMGLLDDQAQPTSKVEDIQIFLEHYNVDVLALAEPEVHGPQSRTFRRNPMSD